MKKIIKGSLYDTETAKLLGEDSYGNSRDFARWYEALYRTKAGKYFLFGSGGPASKYVREIGQNEWSGGEKIIPLTLEAAQKWAEEHLEGDEYIAAFGSPEEGEERLGITITPQTKTKLADIKVKTGKTYGEIIDDAIAKYQI